MLDVLRGFALLGVILVHTAFFPAPPTLATEAQLAALPGAAADAEVQFVIQWLAYDKANTLFATLFGIGFWVQLERMAAKGGRFEMLYLRRLAVLLVFGLAHLLVLWPWDILHLYAVAGFALFAMRKASLQAMLWLGLGLAIAGKPVLEVVFALLGISGPALDRAYSDAAILDRQAAAVAGDLPSFLARMAELVLFDWVASGIVLGWIAYALGRFLLGAWIARRGWLQRAPEYMRGFRTGLLVALPLGLAGQFVAAALAFGRWPETLAPFALYEPLVHYTTVPLLAVGYVCLLVVLYHSAARPLTLVFAPVGRMALTNYVAQSLLYWFLFYGFGPGPITGLGLAGSAGASFFVPCGLAFFALQIVASHLWLRSFAYGPLEWCWRAFTYGSRPPMRRQLAPA